MTVSGSESEIQSKIHGDLIDDQWCESLTIFARGTPVSPR